MLRNYITTALRNLARNRLFATINIAGLAVGFAAALLVALFIRNEFSFASYFPDHERIYMLVSTHTLPNRAPRHTGHVDDTWAKLLRLDFPEIEKIARFSTSGDGFSMSPVKIRRGGLEQSDYILWADPEMLEIFKFRPVAGNLTQALALPDSVILSRSTARKYFSRDDVVGEVLEFDGTPFTVTAVIEDPPSNVNSPIKFVAAGQSASSRLTFLEKHPMPPGNGRMVSYTYMKLVDAGAAQEIAARLPDFVKRRQSELFARWNSLSIVPLEVIRFPPPSRYHGGHPLGGGTSTGNLNTVLALTAVGLLILFAAAINFVNLMTARATRRAVEVGVRKVAGAARAALVVQFIGEAMIYAATAMAVGLALAAALLPALNIFLDRTIAFDLLGDSRATAFVIGLVALVGVLAGLYPAFVLSAFRPAAVLKAGMLRGHASAAVRQVLVVLQFAVLIGLLLATAVTFRQIQFAITQAQRLDTDAVVIVSQTCGRAGFKNEISALPGVRAAICSGGGSIFGGTPSTQIASGSNREPVSAMPAIVDAGFFEFYGLEPAAGRFFAPDRPSDVRVAARNAPMHAPVVLNETAVRALGFDSPQAAVGQSVKLAMGGPTEPSEIIGVVPDYALDSISTTIPPVVYYVDPVAYAGVMPDGSTMEGGSLSIRVDGARAPETLAEIDKLWKQFGHPRPIARSFLDQQIQALYDELRRQGTIFGIFAAVAVFIGLLGLYGLSAFAAEQRTQEIGVRKAMGASRKDILRLLVWQFTRPVLWANLIAWPVAGYFMQRWLQTFAYNVGLEVWVFLAVSAAALAIAVLTVLGHALVVARAKPVTALRYE